MGATALMRALAACAAFLTGAFMVPWALGLARRAQAARRADAVVAQASGGGVARLLRNGIAPATRLALALSRFPPISRYFSQVSWFARQRGYRSDAGRVGGVILALAATLSVVGWALSASPVFGLMLSACCVAGLGIVSHQARERQVEEMREEVPDMLHTMGACFQAGYTLLQTFQHLAGESHGAMRKMFLRAESDLKTGRSAAEALDRMRAESALPELAFVTAALEIQHQTGGSMQKILESARESVEAELALRRSLRVQTAQARLSMRVVTVMPFVLIGVFSLVSPGFLAPFFESGLGLAVFCVAMGMQVAGILSVRHMLHMKED